MRTDPKPVADGANAAPDSTHFTAAKQSLHQGMGLEIDRQNQQPNPLKADVGDGLLRLQPAEDMPVMASECTTLRRFPEPIPFHQIEALMRLIEMRKPCGEVIPFRVFPEPVSLEQDGALRKLLRYRTAA